MGVPAVCLNAIALRIQSGRYRPAPLNPPIVPQADLLRSDTQRPDVVTRVSTTACGIRGRSLVKCWSGAGRSKKIGPFDPGARQRYTPAFASQVYRMKGPPARGLVLLGPQIQLGSGAGSPNISANIPIVSRGSSRGKHRRASDGVCPGARQPSTCGSARLAPANPWESTLLPALPLVQTGTRLRAAAEPECRLSEHLGWQSGPRRRLNHRALLRRTRARVGVLRCVLTDRAEVGTDLHSRDPVLILIECPHRRIRELVCLSFGALRRPSVADPLFPLSDHGRPKIRQHPACLRDLNKIR
jgi:hypothetical protein